MDARGTLHERHHTTLQPDVLIAESGPDLEARMPLPEVFDSSADDSEARLLLPPDVPNSSSSAHLEGGRCEDDPLEAAVDCSHASAFEASRVWDETHRFGHRFGGLPALDVLDIMRESSRVLRRQSDLLTAVTAAFIVPVSVIILVHVLVTRPVINWVEMCLQAAVFEGSVAAVLQTPFTKYISLKVAEFVVTSVLCIPLAVSLAALSKAGVIFTVASTYAGLKVSFVEIMHRVVPRVWLPLIVTYASSCVIFLASGVAVLLCVGFFNGLLAALHASSSIMLLVFTILGLTFCGVFVYLKIILNIADVVCVLEDVYGFAALARSFSIVQGRLHVAVWSYLVTGLCGGFIMLLFEFRVTDKNEYTKYNSSGAWEGPLLVLMHSFVYLFDDIMTTVFYFTCPASSSLEEFDRPRDPEGAGSISVASL